MSAAVRTSLGRIEGALAGAHGGSGVRPVVSRRTVTCIGGHSGDSDNRDASVHAPIQTFHRSFLAPAYARTATIRHPMIVISP